MTSQSLHALASSLQAVPVAMIFSTQRLLDYKSSAEFDQRSNGGEKESPTVRATKLTMVLKDIQGYTHSGLNE
jgi:hypothetical protein